MKAVILAAGKSTRTYPLTVYKPKPMLKVANKTLLEHNLQQLQSLVDEVVIVVGHEGRQIQEHFGSHYRKLKLTYVEQKYQLGTGHALIQAESKVSDEFIVLMGDDLYSREDLKRCLKREYAILSRHVPDVSAFGAVIEKNNRLVDIKEKQKRKTTTLANTGVYVLDKAIFTILRNMKKSKRGEYEITDALVLLSKKKPVEIVIAAAWRPITYPWSLLEANEAALKKVKRHNEGTVEKGATIKGEVVIGRGTLIRSGAYIEGPVVIGEDCDIGPNCYIRPGTSIGNNCRVGNGVEIKNSILMDRAAAAHLSYVGDSIISDYVNLGCGFITANWRHDDEPIKSMVNGKLVSTGRRKLGVIMGDHAKTGIHTSVYPGRKIWPYKTTLPGEVVKKDVD